MKKGETKVIIKRVKPPKCQHEWLCYPDGYSVSAQGQEIKPGEPRQPGIYQCKKCGMFLLLIKKD